MGILPVMGIRTFTYSREYRDRPTGISGKAYIAVQQEADGSDSIVMAAIRFQPQYEIVFTDNILTLSNTLRMLEFKNFFPCGGIRFGHHSGQGRQTC